MAAVTDKIRRLARNPSSESLARFASYVYDGDNHKVKASGGSVNALYWYDENGNVLAETTGTKGGGELDNYIYFGGSRIAKAHIYPGVTYVSYYLHDHLGTARMMVDQGGNTCY
jgi:hypothetical protein